MSKQECGHEEGELICHPCSNETIAEVEADLAKCREENKIIARVYIQYIERSEDVGREDEARQEQYTLERRKAEILRKWELDAEARDKRITALEAGIKNVQASLNTVRKFL